MENWLHSEPSQLAGKLLGRLWSALSYRFGLAAFLMPLGVRAIPEIIVGPYPVGFDTMAFYVPNTLNWLCPND